ncbi:MAG: cation:proton antiporter [Acidobacteriota bacterium]|nr:MAG: cation:proton antiporter [Acidobacteriota bacterium]
MEQNLTEVVLHLVFQLAVILCAAKVGGEIAERFLKQPAVLGELVMGMLIGPFFLGQYIHLPHVGALFPPPVGHTPIAVSGELWAFAQVAVIILLFIAGLETDLGNFLRYGAKAFVIGLGGVIAPFFLGAWATSVFTEYGIMSPMALFMGSAMTATSVGITARVLSDIHKLGTPEGVSILAAAVIDDVLGLLVLAIVIAMAAGAAVDEAGLARPNDLGGLAAADETGHAAADGEQPGLDWGKLGWVALKAFGIWIGVTAAGIFSAKYIERLFSAFKSSGAKITLSLALCFLISAFVELFGLAMIIGAYSIGLGLSQTAMSKEIIKEMEGLYHALVPVFFVVMGMLVSFPAMREEVVFGIVLSLLAIASKVFGCGLPALGLGFNVRGATRIGLGMLPRGEVALIIAGMGLARGAIDTGLFGVVIMMTVVTTFLAPVLLVPAFRGGDGLKSS